MADEWRVKMFYDGQCPFCRWEVRWLTRRNRQGFLAFEDLSDPNFDPSVYGLSEAEVRDFIHGVLPDGTVLRGLEVFRQAYRVVGLGWLTAPTAWPVLRPMSDAAYRLFARNRVRLGKWIGRDCSDETCGIKRH
jgi:predicted DCC family thiol-disulfide oxidoreductase YuxK